MKTLTGTLLSLGIVGLLAACSKNEPAPAAGPDGAISETKMTARVGIKEATPKIAAAECEREMKCKNVGESLKFSSMEHCKTVKSEELNADFNKDEDCKNGMSQKDLDECTAKTVEQTCGGVSSVVSSVERSAECGSNELCMD